MTTMTATPTATTIAVCQRFRVDGMSCGHCEVAVTAALAELAGVTLVVVDVPAGTAVTESVEPLDLDEVAAAVDEAGYRLVRP